MINNKESGWLPGVKQIRSPHFAQRSIENDIDLIVIHGISLPKGKFGTPYVEALFSGTLETAFLPEFSSLAGVTVSPHLYINRSGEATQFVSLYDVAWHAGVSEFQGRNRCNEFSIGIELEGVDTVPYEDVQYDQLVILIKEIMRRFPKITLDRIVGHNEIAPGRKMDPGAAFDWRKLRWNLSQF